MKGTTRRAIILVAIALAGLAATACSGDEEAAKADGSGPVTLRIGTDDEPGRPAADQIEELARRVAELSDGALRLEPVWHAAGDGPDWDQRVARMVSTGELDMGLIPSRSWDTEGVTSLRALNAPFLVTSDELVAEVISGDLAGKLLSGLGEAGVEGIALFPEGLRHPFGYEKPLVRPEDYQGKAIRTPTSRTTSAVFAALGATANDDEADPSTHAGLESSYALDPGGTAAGNVTFYPKVNSLVIDDAGARRAERGAAHGPAAGGGGHARVGDRFAAPGHRRREGVLRAGRRRRAGERRRPRRARARDRAGDRRAGARSRDPGDHRGDPEGQARAPRAGHARGLRRRRGRRRH